MYSFVSSFLYSAYNLLVKITWQVFVNKNHIYFVRYICCISQECDQPQALENHSSNLHKWKFVFSCEKQPQKSTLQGWLTCSEMSGRPLDVCPSYPWCLSSGWSYQCQVPIACPGFLYSRRKEEEAEGIRQKAW